MSSPYDAVVIGSGPNGLCAGIALAQAGRKVLIREAKATVGGSCRSAELTLPGYVHDICSTVQALALVSPFIRSLPLDQHGLRLIHPAAPFAHPLDDGTAAVAERSVESTANTLGVDADAYRKVFLPLLESWDKLSGDLLGPARLPRHPIKAAKFGMHALRSARGFAQKHFTGDAAKGLFAGAAAHSILPLESPATASFGLVLSLSAHSTGWPVAEGGSQKLADALASYFKSLGGTIELNASVANIDEIEARTILCDVSPRQLIAIAGHRMPYRYRERLERFRFGPGVWKVDWALDAPIPWTAAGCRRAGTVHLGGTLDEISIAEAAPWEGRHADRPYVLVVQATLFDPSRAPAGKHTAWAYCHVPHGSAFDMTSRIEAQIERFAPGFRDRILARHVMSPADMERHNPNLIGGDITGGANLLSQLFTRPIAQIDPYRTAIPGVYLCSASTPPGGGVHGLCGYFAAQSAIRHDAG